MHCVLVKWVLCWCVGAGIYRSAACNSIKHCAKKLRWRSRSRTRFPDEPFSGMSEESVVQELYEMFCAGVPIMLLRILFVVMAIKCKIRGLDCAEVFSGVGSVLNGMKFFGYAGLSFELEADEAGLIAFMKM